MLRRGGSPAKFTPALMRGREILPGPVDLAMHLSLAIAPRDTASIDAASLLENIGAQ